MKIILLGYNGLIGRCVLDTLFKYFKKKNFELICISRNIDYQPIKYKNIKYLKWNFINFTKSELFFFGKKNIIINCVGKNNINSSDIEKINLMFIKKLIKFLQVNKLSGRLIHLSSVSVYGSQKNFVDQIKNISENSFTKGYDLYSKSKLKSDLFIKSKLRNKHQRLTYTILRISNVYSKMKNSNSFRLIKFLLNKGIWFKYSNHTNYHFINAKDVALSVVLCILKLKKTENKTYIVSDEVNQLLLHKTYAKKKKFKLFIIPLPKRVLKIIIKYLPLPKKILNLFLIISSQIIYNNYEIKKDLNFNYRYSLKNKIQ